MAQQQSSQSPRTLFAQYQSPENTFDEFFDPEGKSRSEALAIGRALERLGSESLRKRQRLASSTLLNAGVTFSVYSDSQATERVFPFDLIPRIVSAEQWTRLEAGLRQRVTALNAFLADVYGPQAILKEKVIDPDLVLSSSGYLKKMHGIRPPNGVYVHIAGIDLIRDAQGEFLVLEDNARTPSGVSYVLENRAAMKRTLPRVFRKNAVRPVDAYPAQLRKALLETAPVPEDEAVAVVLTPGPFNSAYFEHSFLARRMGCPLVHPSDLIVQSKAVYLRTTGGLQRVDVIYRRIDDEFLDPKFFRKDSLLGVPGIVEAYSAGNVTLANAIGNGVADDKAIYPHVPKMIRFYLSEEPLLGQVPTYDCTDPTQLSHVLENLNQLVVKAVDGSGGYGLLMGPTASQAELDEFAGLLSKDPRGYIAQPRIELSTVPTLCDGVVEPRRVDLRPFVLTGKDTWVLPGGLCRVALKRGSYVVNSSQGGGSKDTWVLGESK